jgi:pyruvate dehydrogenase E1 component alpha subunit
MQQSATIPKTVDIKKDLLFLYQMLLIRRFEEKAAEQYAKAKIRGFLHLYIGEEAVAVGVTQALNDDDNVLSTYRDHGHALAKGMDADVIMAELYGKQQGCSRGRGGSMHLFDVSKNFYGGNAIVGAHIPIAIGMALAAKKQKKTNITCCFFGEGAIAEGEFHEGLNLAALWKVPILFVCENNLYAMGTAIKYTHANIDLEKKGAAYGIESTSVDGMDLMAVINAANSAVEKVRSSGTPHLLVSNTYRFRAHSMADAELYRDKNEVEEWKKRDPIPQFEEYLLQQKLITPDEITEMEHKIEKKIQIAVDFAEAGTWEPIEELTKFVYSESIT